MACANRFDASGFLSGYDVTLLGSPLKELRPIHHSLEITLEVAPLAACCSPTLRSSRFCYRRGEKQNARIARHLRCGPQTFFFLYTHEPVKNRDFENAFVSLKKKKLW